MLFMEDCFIRHSSAWKEIVMKREIWRMATIVALVLVPGLLSAQERRADIRLEPDLVYGKGGDVDLKLDVAMPKEGSGPFPAVVCVHGGGWKAGNRQSRSIQSGPGRGQLLRTHRFHDQNLERGCRKTILDPLLRGNAGRESRHL